MVWPRALLLPLLLLAWYVPCLLGARARVQRRLQRLLSERNDDVVPVSGTFDNSQKPRPPTAAEKEKVSFIEEEKPGPPQVLPSWSAREEEQVIAVSGTFEKHPDKRVSLIGIPEPEASASTFAEPEVPTSLILSSGARRAAPRLFANGTQARWADESSISAVSGTFDDMSTNPEKRARLLALPQFSTWVEEHAVRLSSENAGDVSKGQMMSSEVFVSPKWTEQGEDEGKKKRNATSMQNPYSAVASQVLALAQQQPGWKGVPLPLLQKKDPNDLQKLLNTNPIPTKQPQVVDGSAGPGLTDTVEVLMPARNKIEFVGSWISLVSFAVGAFLPCSLVCCGLAFNKEVPDGSLPS